MQDNSSEYRKILNRPEARHRYWHVLKGDRDFFPAAHELFKLEFDNKLYDMKINHKDDIMTGKLFERYRFLEGDRIIVKKKKNGTFVLDAPDTKLYPNIK